MYRKIIVKVTSSTVVGLPECPCAGLSYLKLNVKMCWNNILLKTVCFTAPFWLNFR